MITHGQHEGRADRIEKTASWLGATPLTQDGRPLPTLDVPGLSEKELLAVFAEVEMARQTLDQGVRVVVSEMNPKARQFIKGCFTPSERSRITFDPDDPDEEVTVVETIPVQTRAVRDVVRP